MSCRECAHFDPAARAALGVGGRRHCLRGRIPSLIHRGYVEMFAEWCRRDGVFEGRPGA